VDLLLEVDAHGETSSLSLNGFEAISPTREAAVSAPLAVILAAGESRRMGLPKALLDAGGETFAARLARVFTEAGCEVLIIVGADAATLRPRLPPVRIVENAGWSAGQFSSVRVGLGEAQARAVLVHPVDVPLVRPETVTAVLAALGSSAAVVPTHHGASGHPLGLAAEAVERIVEWNDVPHLEAAVARLNATRLEVPDPAILQEADTPQEYQALFGRPPRIGKV
jgi:CTP:molybdopterin cytidylyltransferase MocA